MMFLFFLNKKNVLFMNYLIIKLTILIKLTNHNSKLNEIN